MGKINFGVGIPTGTEGLMYPVPFAKVRDNIRISKAAEAFGYDSVWGNDHVSTQFYVRDEFGSPPNYYAPLITLAAMLCMGTYLKIPPNWIKLSLAVTFVDGIVLTLLFTWLYAYNEVLHQERLQLFYEAAESENNGG